MPAEPLLFLVVLEAGLPSFHGLLQILCCCLEKLGELFDVRCGRWHGAFPGIPGEFLQFPHPLLSVFRGDTCAVPALSGIRARFADQGLEELPVL